MPKRSRSTRNTRKSSNRSPANRSTFEYTNPNLEIAADEGLVYSEDKGGFCRVQDLSEGEKDLLLPVDAFLSSVCPKMKAFGGVWTFLGTEMRCIALIRDYLEVESCRSLVETWRGDYLASLIRVEMPDDVYKFPGTYILVEKIAPRAMVQSRDAA